LVGKYIKKNENMWSSVDVDRQCLNMEGLSSKYGQLL
jgi:hypothetical protein